MTLKIVLTGTIAFVLCICAISCYAAPSNSTSRPNTIARTQPQRIPISTGSIPVRSSANTTVKAGTFYRPARSVFNASIHDESEEKDESSSETSSQRSPINRPYHSYRPQASISDSQRIGTIPSETPINSGESKLSPGQSTEKETELSTSRNQTRPVLPVAVHKFFSVSN